MNLMQKQNQIKNILKENINIKQKLIKGKIPVIAKIAELIILAYKNGGKLIIFGNGGSASDSQHIAAELVGRFKKERKGLAAISLNTNTSIITALANDYGYDIVFSRQIEALGKANDIALAISTSGQAQNVNKAVLQAKRMGMKTIGLTGKNGGKLAKLADISLVIPSNNTARIQEAHITIGHIICELVEDALI